MEKQTARGEAWVLLSGGIDSAACLQLLVSQEQKVTALHVDFGQPAAKQERCAVDRLAKHYNVQA